MALERASKRRREFEHVFDIAFLEVGINSRKARHMRRLTPFKMDGCFLEKREMSQAL